MVTATCVECDEEIEINDRPRRGLRIICPNCGAQLEVTNTTPLELDLPFDDEEEEDDDWDDEIGGSEEEFDDDAWDNDEFDDFEDDDDWEDYDDDDDWN